MRGHTRDRPSVRDLSSIGKGQCTCTEGEISTRPNGTALDDRPATGLVRRRVGWIEAVALVVIDDEHAPDGRAIDAHDPQRSPAVNGHAQERKEGKCDREKASPRHTFQIVTVIRAVGIRALIR